MSGLFDIFNIAKSGMSAQQTALQVISHNVANASTDGYSVQRANITATQPSGAQSLYATTGPGQLGTGAEVSSITRSRDIFVDQQFRNEQASLSKYQALQDNLSQVETIFSEPSDTGLSTTIGNMWDAWQQLSTNPESQTARTLVEQNTVATTQSINHDYQMLSDLQTNNNNIIQEQDFQINSVLKQIQDLNGQIKAVTITGQQPNDLMDKRDLLLDQLSNNFGINVENTDQGGITISAKVNGTQTQILSSSDSTQDLGFAYINKIDSQITSNGSQVEVLNTDSENNPKTIEFNGTNLGLNSDGSVNVNSVNLVNNSTAKFGDGKTITINNPSKMSIYIGDNNTSQPITIDTSNYSSTGKIQVTQSDGTTTDVAVDTKGNAVVNGVTISLNSSGNITSYENNGETVSVDSSTGNISVNANGSNVSFDGNNITVGSGGTIKLSDMTSSNIKYNLELYMNGDVNQPLTITNVDSSQIGSFESTHTVLFNSSSYQRLLQNTPSADFNSAEVKNLNLTAAQFDSGSLNGYEAASQDIQNYKDQLNNLARGLAISINTIQSNDGQALNFFDSSAETATEPASTITVNQSIADDVSQINTGTEIPGDSGDGSRALLIGQLSDTKMDLLNIKTRADFMKDVNFTPTPQTLPANFQLSVTSSPTGTTLNDYYQSTITSLGVDSQNAQKNVTNQTSLVNQLTSRRQSISGVSLDEEMTNMLQYQKAYEANAKMINTINQLLDVVVNGLVTS